MLVYACVSLCISVYASVGSTLDRVTNHLVQIADRALIHDDEDIEADAPDGG